MTKQLRVLTRANILDAEDRQTEWVDVPEWGGRVLVRSLEGLERDRYEASMVRYGRNAKGVPEIEGFSVDNLRARLAAMTIIDEAGANLFTESDVLILGHKSAAALERVFKVAQRLSNLTDADVEELKQQLGNARNDASGSGSPAISA
ncbi:MAG: hypothetical protein ACRDGQ_06705 [Candidatus Limnocylindrales bacterium]